MTLRRLTFHKDIVKSEKIEGQRIVETKFANLNNRIEKSGFYEPNVAHEKMEAMNEAGYEKPSHYDPNKLAEIPQGNDDSRSLLEAGFSLKIEIGSQTHIKEFLVELFNDAITTTEDRLNTKAGDAGRVRYFDGIKESLIKAKEDIYLDGDGINEKICLYHLVDKCEKICSQFHELITSGVFNNSEESKYSESYHLGLASGYKNVSEMIKNKLAREENNRYRSHINPSQ